MPRRRGSNNLFGFEGLGPSTRSARIRLQGRVGEERFRMGALAHGREVRKIHKGGDFIEEYRTDMFGNRLGKRRKPLIHEVKTGGSRLSPAQREMQRRSGKRYKVTRY